MLSFGLKSSRRIFYAGEKVRVFLQNDTEFPPGKAFLRTNVGMAAIRRREIIDLVENNNMFISYSSQKFNLRVILL